MDETNNSINEINTEEHSCNSQMEDYKPKGKRRIVSLKSPKVIPNKVFKTLFYLLCLLNDTNISFLD